ncbi:heme NO-binding domain-containing protein [Hydrocarboniphaga effusa]|uniref:heme NO-binding domain-containing protein n=1 Tax=Hydrocarboniphaga effusa TaxID=243629 RepID=UPI003137FDBB
MIGLGFNFAERYLLETHGDEALVAALQQSGLSAAEPWLDSLDYADADFDRWIESCAAIDQCSSEALLLRLGRWAMPRLLRRYALLGLESGSPKALLPELAERLLPQLQRSLLLMQQPEIELECGETRAELAYRSRGELCALFEGALQGLGEQFDVRWRIEHVQCEGRGDDCCRFRIALPETLAA